MCLSVWPGRALRRPRRSVPLSGAMRSPSVRARSRAKAVRLTVGEALTNVVMHAYVGGQVGSMSVQAWLDEDEHLAVLVLDEGPCTGF